jgi:hypothetical protein
MPKRDGKGPSGMGPLSGSGQGDCIIRIDTPEAELKYLLDRQAILTKELAETGERIAALRQEIAAKDQK